MHFQKEKSISNLGLDADLQLAWTSLQAVVWLEEFLRIQEKYVIDLFWKC